MEIDTSGNTPKNRFFDILGAEHSSIAVHAWGESQTGTRSKHSLMGNMNKAELVEKIADKTSLPKNKTTEILDAITSAIADAVASGESVKLVGFGTFEARDREPRQGRNPQTGETMEIPATRVPAFSAGKQFKNICAS